MRRTIAAAIAQSTALIAIVFACATHASAAHVAVTNPGFEDISGESPFNEFTFGPLNGWNLHDPGNITSGGAGNTYFIGTLTPFQADPVGHPGVYANFPAGAAEGQRVAISFNFFGSGNQGEYGYLQTLAATLQPRTRYRLQVEIGNIASANASNGQFFDLDGFPGYRVDLLAGGIPISQDLNSLAGLIDEGHFRTSTITFTTGASHPQLGQALGIRLVNLNHVDPLYPDSDLEVDFDNVRLDATPLPLGDFNRDGAVDSADYVVWRKSINSSDEYDTWVHHYGESINGGGSGDSSSAPPIPEPRSQFSILIAAALFGGFRRLLR